ncbi:hypothetical protein HS048_18260 [Planomonospora sp. ID91781]|uniref:hypothetical protein n=1 Tax=Planomonospora sp. ID91781 TaxID=2738135 RepID=UPI0018C43682|nr:hypothetical protein [Planomonospora sp. ID91781]MBG0822683.1 hypothetical protein [Planomonospora sp. ID91781]
MDLLVVGAPTHAFGMSRPATRQSAAQQAPAGLVSKGRGLREWLAALDDHVPAVAAAAFDTRVENPWVPGSARHGADRRLRRKGFARPFTPRRWSCTTCASSSARSCAPGSTHR